MVEDSPYRPDPPRYPRNVSDAEVASVMDEVRARQRPVRATAFGLIAAIVATVVVVTALHRTGWTDWLLLSWSCVVVVAAVSLWVRILGRGVQPRYALLGAVVGLLVPLVGELYAIVLAKSLVSERVWQWEIGAFIQTRGGWDWVLFLICALGGAKLSAKGVTIGDIRRKLGLRPRSERKQVLDELTKWNHDM